jgi:hypothetical protein
MEMTGSSSLEILNQNKILKYQYFQNKSYSVIGSGVEMRLYSLQMAFDSAQADTIRPFETASCGPIFQTKKNPS